MDVSGATSSRFYPSSGDLLLGFGASKLPAQNTAGRHPFVGDKEAISWGRFASSKRAHVPAYMRHEFAETSRGPFR